MAEPQRVYFWSWKLSWEFSPIIPRNAPSICVCFLFCLLLFLNFSLWKIPNIYRNIVQWNSKYHPISTMINYGQSCFIYPYPRLLTLHYFEANPKSYNFTCYTVPCHFLLFRILFLSTICILICAHVTYFMYIG